MEITESLLSDLVIWACVPYPNLFSADEVAAPHHTHEGVAVKTLADERVGGDFGSACDFPARVAFACLS